MAYRPHPKGAATSSTSPRAWATCDRTGFINNHNKLNWQYEWAGANLINLGVLVRPQSLDKPQQQFRSLVLPPDPKPIFNARPEPYAIEENTPVTTQIAVDAGEGDATIFVQSVAGFTLQKIYVYLDNGGFALCTITSIDSMANSFDISPALPSASSVDQLVTAAGSDDIEP